MAKKNKFNQEAYLAQIRKWAEEQLAAGVSRQGIEQALLKAEIDWNDPNAQAIVSVYNAVAKEYGANFYQRNEKGTELEKAGRIDEAIQLYEANVADQFMGSHPYKRLRVIYGKRKDYRNALRVSQMAANNPYMGERSQKEFAEWVEKYKNKLEG